MPCRPAEDSRLAEGSPEAVRNLGCSYVHLSAHISVVNGKRVVRKRTLGEDIAFHLAEDRRRSTLDWTLRSKVR